MLFHPALFLLSVFFPLLKLDADFNLSSQIYDLCSLPPYKNGKIFIQDVPMNSFLSDWGENFFLQDSSKIRLIRPNDVLYSQ